MDTLLTIVAASALLGFQLPAQSAGGVDSSASSATSASQLSDDTKGSSMLKVGDTIEDFTIPIQFAPNGEEEVTLSTLLKEGPVVLTFFRGSWCPYCRGELSDIQDNMEKFDELGAKVIAISPEVSEKGNEMAKELDLTFFVGHDENNELARSLDLTFTLDDKTIEKYKGYKINVAKSNGTPQWELPIPATYVIDQDSVVQYVFDDENYSKRADYKKVVKVVKKIQADD